MKKSVRISKRAVISLIMTILSIIGAIYFLYAMSLLSGIENMIRLILSFIIVTFVICFIIGFISSIKKRNNSYIVYSIFCLIYSILLIFSSYYVVKTYKVVDNFTTTGTVYSSSLVTLKDNNIKDIKKVTGKVGMIDEEENIVGSVIPQDIINKEKLNVEQIKYSSYIEVINALYEGKITYAFLPTNYAIMFSSYEGKDLSNIDEETKIIYTKEKTVQNTFSSKKESLTKPFTILLMGVDSETEEIANSSFNGDSLMLITFNPSTLNTTMLSIPRDSYVPIACFSGNKRNKITHAAWGGESCMIKTIENFIDVKIDYYVKINFKGVVNIVDALGGVEVDVPYSFCEQDSNRKFGNNTIYVNKGYQTLNGEQALAFSRNRHPWPQYCPAEYSNYVSNDFIRGQNQQSVLKSILNKIKEKGDIQTIYNLLDVVSKSMETNMSTNEILSLYNVGKDIISSSSSTSNIADIIGIQRLYLSGEGASIYEESMKLNLYNYVLFNESISEVSEAMKINLGLIKPTLIKTFSFDINEDYEEKIIGKMSTGTTIKHDGPKYDDEEKIKVPNFVGLTYKEAKELADSLGLYLNAIENQSNSKVKTQDVEKGLEVNKGVTIKLTFDSDKEETDGKIKVPNFVGLSYKESKEKAKAIGLYLNVPDNTTDNSVVKTQDVKDGVEVNKGVTIKLTFEVKEQEEVEKVKLPNFIGLSYKEAKQKAASLGLYLNVPINTMDNSIVSTQDVKDGVEVNKGVTIKLTFKVEEVEEVPDTEE